ncbi:MAG TPA: hypothetical protein DCW72_03940 [Elusimicrobia bacterium]|nr:MAG: hypothetical protein A2X29_10795 [Elusimicrobia bacterium GWA2_64_40]HAN05944.1 hypothetical protein [Elusimicrobiota bacterium]HAU89399.1 hypothetical protein [Elusimicrobiota bacterium]
MNIIDKIAEDPSGVTLAVAAVVIIPAVAAAWFLDHRKNRWLENFAEAKRLRFEPEVPYDLRNTGLEIFNNGYDFRLLNRISGISCAGAAVSFFDYKFRAAGGREKGRYSLTAALFEFKSDLFPAFTLRQEGILDELKAVFGVYDIDVPGDKEFCREYHLSGRDKDAVAAFWTPERTKKFKLPARCRLEAKGRWLAIYRYAATVDEKNYETFMEEAKAAAAVLAGQGPA